MIRARFRPPLWFELLIALLGAWFVSWLAATYPPAPHARGALPDFDTHAAFLSFLFALAGWIWNGLQAAGHLTLAALASTVHFLWEFAKQIHNGLIELGGEALKAFRSAWGFLRGLYDQILLPAWRKFWRVVDWARRSLEDLFKPVFRVLRTIRDDLLKWYARFIRPVLDTIDVARSILRIIGKLGFEWARTLDRELGSIESAIDSAFRLVLRKVNEVINAVNRVVTADGLFQRVALVRSIGRDFAYVGDEWARMFKAPATAEEIATAKRQKYPVDDPKVYGEELEKFYRGEDSAYAGIIGELVHEWRTAAGLETT